MHANEKSKSSRVIENNFVRFGSVTLLAASAIFILAGCGKSSPSSAPAPQPTASTQTPPAPAPASPAPAAPAPGPDGSTADTTAKLAAADWAIKQDQIKNDPNGEWAILATASSSYNDAQGQAGWSPNQATGLPNVEKYADDGKAWTPKTQDSGIEWLDLKYPKPVYATEVRVRESFNSGSIIRIELFDAAGTAHLVWGGNDPTTGLNYLLVKFPKTSFKTDHLKITLATNVGPGWKEIDAVQLVGTDQ
jgi:hypothetical protein